MEIQMKLKENKTFEGHIVFAYDQNNSSTIYFNNDCFLICGSDCKMGMYSFGYINSVSVTLLELKRVGDFL
jgi:hypothetical protein